MTKNVIELLLHASDQFTDVMRKAQLEMAAMKIGADNFNKEVAKMEKLHPGLSHQEAIAAVDALDMMSKKTVDVGKKGVEAGEKTERSFANARISAQGLGQELGIHLPRAVTTFLAKSETIGPVLSGAFSAVAVFGMIEALGQLPALYDKLVGAVTGWDERTRTAYSNFLVSNKKALDQLVEFQAKMIAIDAPTSRLGEVKSTEFRLNAAQKDVDYYNRIAAQRRNEAEQLIVKGSGGAGASQGGAFGRALTGYFATTAEGMNFKQLSTDAEKWEGLAREAAEKVNGLKREQQALNETIKAEPGRQYGEQVESIVRSLRKRTEDERALAAAIAQGTSQGVEQIDMIRTLGKAAEDAAREHKIYGDAIHDSVAQLAAASEVYHFAEHSAQFLTDGLNAGKQAWTAIGVAQAEAVKSAKDYADSIGAAMTSANASTQLALHAQLDEINAVLKGYDTLGSKALSMRDIFTVGPGDNEDWRKPMDVANNPNLTVPGRQYAGQAIEASLAGMRHVTEIAVTEEHLQMQLTWNRYNTVGKAAIDSVAGSIGQMFTGSITQGKNFWQAFKDLGKDSIASVTRFFIENFVKGALDPFKQTFGKLIAGAGGSLTGGSGGLLGAFGGSGSKSSLLSRLPGVGGLFGGLLASSMTVSAAAPAATTAAVGFSAFPGAAAGGATTALSSTIPHFGTTGGFSALMTNPWTIGIAAGILGGIGLYEIFKHRTREAPFTMDPNDAQQSREYYFYTGSTALAEAAKDLNAVSHNFNTLPPGMVVKDGLPIALQSSNKFRRDMNGILQDDF